MWQNFVAIIKTLFSIHETLQKNRTNINDLQQEVRQLTTALQLMSRELQHIRENEAHEREKMALRLENALLRAGKQLPAPTNEGNE